MRTRPLAAPFAAPEIPGALGGLMAAAMAIFPDQDTCFRWWLLGIALGLVLWTVAAAYVKGRADEQERAEAKRDRTLTLSRDTHELTHTVLRLLYELKKYEDDAERHARVLEIETAYRRHYRRGAERLFLRYRQRGLFPKETTAKIRERANLEDIWAVMRDLNGLVEHVDEEIFRFPGDEDDET